MESQKKEKLVYFPFTWKLFAMEILMFLISLLLGIATALRIRKSKILDITTPFISIWKLMVYFLLSTLFIFVISYFLKLKKNRDIVFKIIFILATFSGGITFLSVWLPGGIPLVFITLLIIWWIKKPTILIQDILIMMAIAGAGSLLGLTLNPLLVVLLLIIFSIYDFIAVFKTKHMVKMAREMIKSRAILALIVPPKAFAFLEGLEKVKSGSKFLILGGGDIIFPLLLSVSLVPSGIFNSLIVAFFSSIGLSSTFLIFSFQKKRQPIPALPPIALFSIIGFLITLLI
jgi:presenilin-like A22 family membrane protease